MESSSRLRERLEDLVCMSCLIAPVCGDNLWHCEAFDRLLKIYELCEVLRRILDAKET